MFKLEVDKDGNLIAREDGETKVMASKVEAMSFMRNAFKRRVEVEGKEEAAKSVVIVRADADASFKKVHELMSIAKTVGFVKLQLRAKIQ